MKAKFRLTVSYAELELLIHMNAEYLNAVSAPVYGKQAVEMRAKLAAFKAKIDTGSKTPAHVTDPE